MNSLIPIYPPNYFFSVRLIRTVILTTGKSLDANLCDPTPRSHLSNDIHLSIRKRAIGFR